MKLLGTPTSPYTRKARLVLLEKNIPHTYILDAPNDPNSQVPRVNPLGRIPALILDSETCVFDSSVIAEYADTLNDTPILIPRRPGLERMCVKRWEALADGIMDSAVAVRMESIRPPEKQDQATIKMHNDAISRALEFAARDLDEREWCEGKAISLADLALVSALIYLDLRQPERNWRSTHPNLSVWFDNISRRPSVQTSMTA